MSTNKGRGVSRRTLLRTGGSGLAFASAVGIAPRYLVRPAHAAQLAPGMTGGPTGFPGAERYQYNEGMSEGRAIEGIKKLKAAGKAPEKLVFLIGDGALNQIAKPYPLSGPSVQEVWERETGIKLELIGVSPEENYPRVMQDITTKSGAYDVYTSFYNEIGDLVESNGVVDLDEYVAKYKPDWNDPKRGAPTKEIYNLSYTYNNKVYIVSLDGDFQTWVYRKDLFEDPQNKKEYEDKFKMPLRQPPTWTEVDQIAQFFKSKGLNGSCNLLSPFWGTSTWFSRYLSYDKPDLFPFDLNGKPLIDSDLGIKAAEAHVKSKDWESKDILTWTYAEAYGSMGDGTGVMMSTYTNLPKFMDRKNADGTPATKATGKFSSFIPPGTLHGELVGPSVVPLPQHVSHRVLAKQAPGGRLSPAAVAQFDPHLHLDVGKSGRLFRPMATRKSGGSSRYRDLPRVPRAGDQRDNYTIRTDNELPGDARDVRRSRQKPGGCNDRR